MIKSRQNSLQAIRINQSSEKIMKVIPIKPTSQSEFQNKKSADHLDPNELRPFLEDLMRRYDKMALELQAAQAKNYEYNDQNQKLIRENDQLKEAAKSREDEVNSLYSKLVGYQNKYGQQIDQLQNDNVKVVQVLTQKIDDLESELIKTQNDLDYNKGLLILREQEVLEWRSRRQFDESKTLKELNQIKQTLQSKEQELQALRIKYDFKQKTTQSSSGQQLELDALRQELYIKEQQLEKINNQENSEQCSIYQNEINRINKIVVDLRSEVEKLKQEQVDYEWLKRRYEKEHQSYSTLRV
ncbi:unnamed protein product (macronuclear) [Paramecium tetraurelia]|uniref:Uncharacterized protein n=1 Tax=Paramecium tetraurelia TaxID=5888 RepID=A0BW02_PARTE|nr:uncharacterized protein GSPATT00032571001 [Paramecium tetraurelia]CAK62719.1 unnamed protein product [Paramecium tetraurelia]|eukprot:XP_001430117.1 hypothetical protein (macronuclear) [Paramecium tetraurelia strain d4-2]